MTSHARVTARGGLRLRDAPGTGAVLASLERDTSVEVLDRETWLKVRVDGRVGFVSADYVEPLVDPANVEPEAGVTIGDAAALELVAFSSTCFVGEPVRADAGFVPCLEQLSDWARELALEVWVTSSFRRPEDRLRGTVVDPARASNHLVGHAIDMNLRSADGFFNSKALSKSNLANLPPAPRHFLARIRGHAQLRWGGDFSKEDPVHIDDGLNLRDRAAWQAKFALA